MPRVANKAHNVKRHDGRVLHGLDAELFLKREADRDSELEKKLLKWIGDVTNTTLKDLYNSLKSGEELCLLLNCIKPDTIETYNKETKGNGFSETKNLELFVAGCRKLGVNETALMAPADLHDGKDLYQVQISDFYFYFFNDQWEILHVG
eukprot:Lithocolla_globosa_v1_NODE_2300_length_2061_cov_17.179462.p1 type:complete len:150 gc:universal NODE_2300_length_2061_cov_17.179462:1185-736(-)